MLSLGIGVNGRKNVSLYDASALAFINATGLTGTTEKTAVNNLVKNLKSYGLWSKMKAIYPFVSDTINLLNYSEDFNSWSKSNTTVTVDTITSPTGTLTADKIIADTVNTQHSVASSIITVTAGLPYTRSVYVKKGEYSNIVLTVGGFAAYNDWKYVAFNLDTNTFTGASGSTTYGYSDAGNGWVRIWFTVTPTTTGNDTFTLKFSNNPANASQGPTFVGNGTSGLYVWGAQFEQSSSVSTYQKITTTPDARFVSQFKYNLKDARDLDAAFRLAFNGTWTYSKQGATPNGVNGFANTYVNAQSNLTFNNTHLSYYSRTDTVTGSKTEMGCVPTATLPLVALSIKRTEGGVSDRFVPLLYSYNSPDIINVSNTNSQGYYLASRTASNSFKGFKNGVQLGSTVTTNGQASAPNLQIYLGATNFNNSGSGFSDRQVAFSTIGDGLTDTEATNLYTAVQTFQTALNRQI